MVLIALIGIRLGLSDRANICELLINVVNAEQANDADRLEPKGNVNGIEAEYFLNRGQEFTGGKEVPNSLR